MPGRHWWPCLFDYTICLKTKFCPWIDIPQPKNSLAICMLMKLSQGMLNRAKHSGLSDGTRQTLLLSRSTILHRFVPLPFASSQTLPFHKTHTISNQEDTSFSASGLPAIVFAIFQPVTPLIAAVMSILLGVESWSTGRLDPV